MRTNMKYILISGNISIYNQMGGASPTEYNKPSLEFLKQLYYYIYVFTKLNI